jgi:hypothetical protein
MLKQRKQSLQVSIYEQKERLLQKVLAIMKSIEEMFQHETSDQNDMITTLEIIDIMKNVNSSNVWITV